MQTKSESHGIVILSEHTYITTSFRATGLQTLKEAKYSEDVYSFPLKWPKTAKSPTSK
jgi:hypothetical protein